MPLIKAAFTAPLVEHFDENVFCEALRNSIKHIQNAIVSTW